MKMKTGGLGKYLRNLLISSPVLGFAMGYLLTHNIIFDLRRVIYKQQEFKAFRSIPAKYPVVGGLIFAVIFWTFVAAIYILVERSKKS